MRGGIIRDNTVRKALLMFSHGAAALPVRLHKAYPRKVITALLDSAQRMEFIELEEKLVLVSINIREQPFSRIFFRGYVRFPSIWFKFYKRCLVCFTVFSQVCYRTVLIHHGKIEFIFLFAS